MIFEVYEVLERKLRTSLVGKWAILAGLKAVMPVRMALQRMFTAEDILSFT